jgi:sugar/nucleoside kinase (ribokinase family)
VIFHIFSETGNDFQADICNKALTHELIVNHIHRNINKPTASCIVLSGQNERTFISDRGCINDMNLSCFDENILLSRSEYSECNNVSNELNRNESIIPKHIHCAGYYNCELLIPQIPDFFQKVILLIYIVE